MRRCVTSQRRCLLIVSALTLVLGARAQAQIGKRVWASVGVGVASANLRCVGLCVIPDDFFASGRAVTPVLLLGLSLGKHFRVDAEWSYWQRAFNNGIGTNQLSTASFAVSYHPFGGPSPFIRGGVGRASMTYTIDRQQFKGAGRVLIAGFGYEVVLGSNVSFVPMLTHHHGVLGGGHPFGTEQTSWRDSLWIFGVAIRLHS